MFNISYIRDFIIKTTLKPKHCVHIKTKKTSSISKSLLNTFGKQLILIQLNNFNGLNKQYFI